MTKETMTVHKALAELKVLDARIFNATSGKTFVASKKVSDKKDQRRAGRDRQEGYESRLSERYGFDRSSDCH